MKKVISILLSLSLIFSSMIMLTGTAFADVNIHILIHDSNSNEIGTVAVPKQDEQPVTINVSAMAIEDGGTDRTGEISFGIDGDKHGVNLVTMGNTASVTIPSTATAGTVTFVASVGGTSATSTLTLTKDPSVATSIGVEMKDGDGSYTAYSDVTHSVEVGTNIYLKAIVYDQYGVAMTTESEKVKWSSIFGTTFEGTIDVAGNPACLTAGTGTAKMKATLTLTGKTLTWGENNVAVTGYVKPSHSVTFADATKTYTYGDTVTNSQVASCTTGTISYSSSDESKVEVNPTNGALTIKKVTGETPVMITATVAATSSNAEGKATYTVTVAKKEASVGLKNVTITKGQTPTFELEWSGLVGNDKVSGADTATAPTVTLKDADGNDVTLDTAKSTVGTYTMTWTNKDDEAFNFTSTNYNITKKTTATLTVTEAKSYGGGSGSSSSSKLETAKNEARSDVKTHTESQKYEDTEAAEVKAIKEQADKDIAAAKTVEEVEKIKAEAEAKIEAVPTAEEKAEIAKVSSINKQVFIATSKKSTLHGKKAVKVSWVLPKGIDVDGFVVYRSTKKGSFGTKPYFTTKNSTYKNNKELKTGTTYYYKVKGYKVINGEKVYTGWSTTAHRTVK